MFISFIYPCSSGYVKRNARQMGFGAAYALVFTRDFAKVGLATHTGLR
jgi:hypothetical protein